MQTCYTVVVTGPDSSGSVSRQLAFHQVSHLNVRFTFASCWKDCCSIALHSAC